jgi:voltage-gated potassium channel
MQLLPLAVTPRAEADRLRRQEGRYVLLLLATLVPMLLLPLTANAHHGGYAVLAAVFSLLILQALHTLSVPSGGLRGLMGRGGYRLLGLLCLAGIWIPPLRGSWHPVALKLAVLLLLSLFFLVSSVRLVQLLARAPRVNARVMAGACAGYLLLGISGGVIATATEVFVPGSFRLDVVADQELLLDRLTYFSFVTIASLGPGDIVAGNAVGERFVMLLSVSSTLYVAMLVGLLLGRFIASQEVEFLEEDLLIESQRRQAGDATESGAPTLRQNPRE